MADRKITDLTALAAGSQATGDLLTIVDVSEGAAADKNKKITVDSLFKGIPSNVGIGESSPGDKLTVGSTSDSSTAVRIQTTTTGNGEIRFGDSGSATAGYIRYAHNGNHLIFARDNTEAMRISSGGNVGIGETSIDRRLHVRKDGAAAAKFGGEGGGVDYAIEIGQLSATSSPGFNATGGGSMLFKMGGTEAMRINSSGRLGIGKTSPSSILHLEDSNNTVLTLGNSSYDDGVIQYYNGSVLLKTGSSSGDRLMTFSTAGSERMRIDSSGRVGINKSSPSYKLEVDGGSNTAARFTVDDSSSGIAGLITTNGANADLEHIIYTSKASIGSSVNIPIAFHTNGKTNEKMRIDSSGNVGIGSSSPGHELVVRGSQPFLELRSSDTGNHAGEDVFSGILFGTDDTSTSVDPHGFIKAVHTRAGSGHSSADAGLTFGTSASTTAPATEQMRITTAGHVLFNNTTTATPGYTANTLGAAFENLGADGAALFVSRSGNLAANFNRAQDGDIVQFSSAGSIEGGISISGSTVSYNGGHLSRWSQLAGNAERIEILRGSVLSNIDEMCEWGEEDNEQLNRMKVSDVEGDVNVSGVFQAWDDDDKTYTNDFYCAMTGDFIIRIAQGTTVSRGDLLMSAGDGTAKPQDDDIVRSKTIAKVTSTTVSTTYADGSYCVPCVLMAC